VVHRKELAVVISLDTETFLISTGQKAPPLVCVGLSDGERSWVLHRSDDWQGAVRAALAQGVTGHHVAYDMCVLAAAGFPLEEIFQAYADNRITCTQAREKLLDIATGAMAHQRKPHGPGYSLGVLVQRRLGVELDKTSVRLDYERLFNVPVAQWPEAYRAYAAHDALYTYRLHAAQEKAEGWSNLVDQYRQARAAFWIQLMSSWGTCVDLERLGELKAKYEAEFAQAGVDLVAAGLARQEKKGLVRNVKVAGARLVEAYARLGKEHPTTDTGAPDLSRESCENASDPALLRYSEYMSLSTKVTKEIPALDRPLLHPYYDALVETGRTSCSGPNLQNLPRKGGFRECLIPRPGFLYVCADYSGFELATLAQVCLVLVGSSKLADALNAGRDVHLEMAAAILGKPYETLDKKDPRVANARQTGKVANFGFPGGLGYTRLIHFAQQSYGVHLTEGQARDLKSLWLSRWPEMSDYFSKIDFAVETHGAIEQLYSGRLRGDVSYTDACNGMFQGLAADIAKDAGFQLARACYVGALRGCRIVNFVHDEYVVEVPEEHAKACAERIEAILVLAARPWLPGVKLGVEMTISRRYKGDYVTHN
jgi:DNA polymerase I-like protein with 3'-5' exonuclease and polymerase domains